MRSFENDALGVVRSVSDWINIMNQINDNIRMPLLYRGHCDESFVLSPSIFRDPTLNESAIINDYLHNVDSLSLRHDEKMIRHLINMQHNGIPTRLMDWSLNSLIALFFACYDENNRTSNGSIHIVDPWPFNSMVIDYRRHPEIHDLNVDLRSLLAHGFDRNENLTNKISELYRHVDIQIILDTVNALEYPMFLIGDYINKRTVAQQAAYCLHGLNRSNLDKFVENIIGDVTRNRDGLVKENILNKVIVDMNSKQNILNELARLGITPYTVYPDFSGFKRTLDYKNHSNKSLFSLS